MRTGARASGATPEEAADLRNWNLTLSSDAQLAAWLQSHMTEMNLLAALSRSGSDAAKMDGLRKSLALAAIGQEDDLVIVTIGGMIDNSVGFMHAGTSAFPSISSSEYIWIEPLLDGWALFKTT